VLTELSLLRRKDSSPASANDGGASAKPSIYDLSTTHDNNDGIRYVDGIDGIRFNFSSILNISYSPHVRSRNTGGRLH
jgi:hypothetical protein